MSMNVVVVLSSVLAALRGALALAATDRTERLRIDNPATPTVLRRLSDMHIVARTNHTPLVDSLIPVIPPSASVALSDPKQITTTAVVIVIAFSALCAMTAIIFVLARYSVRRAAMKRRRQASWILRSGQWNMETKRTYAHDTQSGFSDTSSFSAYPYPLSEHF